MTGSKLIDSSVWINYLFNGVHKDIIDTDDILLLSSLSLFEIKKKLTREDIDKVKVKNSLDFIKKRSLIIPVSTDIAESASDISLEHQLHAIDSLIYTTALLNDAALFTLDKDFKALKNAIVLMGSNP